MAERGHVHRAGHGDLALGAWMLFAASITVGAVVGVVTTGEGAPLFGVIAGAVVSFGSWKLRRSRGAEIDPEHQRLLIHRWWGEEPDVVPLDGLVIRAPRPRPSYPITGGPPLTFRRGPSNWQRLPLMAQGMFVPSPRVKRFVDECRSAGIHVVTD